MNDRPPDQSPSPGTLYVVATPLGNREDLSGRALRVLGEVGLVACEDTRRTGRLLAGHGIQTPRTSFFEHNERWKGERILDRLRAGQDVALVSDAGTPGISDPGYRLVRDARDQELPVVPVPGPSAVTTALSVCGLPTDRFLFAGFLPSRKAARRRSIGELAGVGETLVLYESPLRIVAALGDLLELLGDRPCFLCREATKLHEEYVRSSLSELLERLAERPAVKGEIVLVIAGADEKPEATESLETLYARLTAEGQSRRQAVKSIAKTLGLPARDVYQKTLELGRAERSD